MGTTADKLNRLINTKEGIRQELNRAYETEEISTSDTFNSYIQKLEEHPFYLEGLVEGTIESIKLSNVTSIGNGAFYGCSSLTEVSFPNAKSTGSQAFQYCISLTEITDASFPKATSIGQSAFDSCSSLTKVSFPKATSINLGAFGGCSSLTEVSIPNVEIIGQSAFSGCSSLTEVSFPLAISISSYAFSSCSSLTKVSFPEATSIDERAFDSCSNLTSVSIPNATSVSRNTFSSCSSLTEVSFPNATSIGSNAFYNCSKLTSVSIPNATSIGGNAFESCSSLTEVSFPNVTSIGSYAFDSCKGLTSVSFPKATNLDIGAFYNCSGLTEVSIPNATIIKQSAFNSCSGLTEISFPKATSIGGNVFQSCRGLTSVSLPKAKSIGEYAFRYCSGLTEVSFPVATSIDGYALQYCSSLTTIYVGTESDTICTLSNTNAFNNCPNLTNIYVPASLVDSYKSATNWSSYADKIKSVEQPVECIALSITADDVAIGNLTSTTVHYTAECTYTKNGILQEGTKVFTGKATSDSFEQNTSTTDTVQRTVSFTFFGKTATTTITQGVWINRSISVTTEGISSYGWVTADSKYNVDKYDVYMSKNKGVDDSQAVMKLECVGYTDLTLYIRSYAESSYDYTIASNANASTYPKAYNDSTAKAHTKGNQKSGTSLSDYTKVEYTGLSDNDIIYIVFRKDYGGALDDDRGYVLIPKV